MLPSALVLLLLGFGGEYLIPAPDVVDDDPSPLDSIVPLTQTLFVFTRVLGLMLLFISVALFFIERPWLFSRSARSSTSIDSTSASEDNEASDRLREREIQSRFERATQSHQRIVAAYSDFLFDPIAAFQFPLLNDVRCAQTARFVDALTAANQLSIEEGILSGAMLDKYEQRVRHLVTTWDVAETHARRVGLAEIPVKVRDDVERAIRLLRYALDEASTAERTSFLDKAAEIVASAARSGYLVVAAETAEAIGHQELLQITAGSSS